MARVTDEGEDGGAGRGPGAVAATKAALRADLLAARRARTAVELGLARGAVVEHIVTMAVERRWRRVAAYEPLRTEPGSRELLAGLSSLGVAVIVPVTLDGGELDWEPWPRRGVLGAAAIGGVDAVLVPALAVARDGARLGRGRGYYDRAVTRCRADVDLVAVVFDDELLDTVPVEPWDAPMGWAVRPAGVTRLQRNTAVGPDL